MIKITEMPDGRNRKVSDSSHQVNDHEKQMRNDRRRGKRMLMSPGRLRCFALSAQP
jgi:hypothetical protein